MRGWRYYDLYNEEHKKLFFFFNERAILNLYCGIITQLSTFVKNELFTKRTNFTECELSENKDTVYQTC